MSASDVIPVAISVSPSAPVQVGPTNQYLRSYHGVTAIWTSGTGPVTGQVYDGVVAPTVTVTVGSSGSVGANLAPSTSYDYAVTIVDPHGNESLIGVLGTGAESTTAYPITVTWTTFAGYTYNIYKAVHGSTLHVLQTGVTTPYVDSGNVATSSTAAPATSVLSTLVDTFQLAGSGSTETTPPHIFSRGVQIKNGIYVTAASGNFSGTIYWR
jgi:hypothetical protein